MYSHPTSLRRLRNLRVKVTVNPEQEKLLKVHAQKETVFQNTTHSVDRNMFKGLITLTNVLGGGGAGTVVLAEGEIGCTSTCSNPDIGTNSKAHTLDPSSVSLAPLPLYIQSTFANRHPSVFSIVPLLRGLVLVVELPPIVAR